MEHVAGIKFIVNFKIYDGGAHIREDFYAKHAVIVNGIG